MACARFLRQLVVIGLLICRDAGAVRFSRIGEMEFSSAVHRIDVNRSLFRSRSRTLPSRRISPHSISTSLPGGVGIAERHHAITTASWSLNVLSRYLHGTAISIWDLVAAIQHHLQTALAYFVSCSSRASEAVGTFLHTHLTSVETSLSSRSTEKSVMTLLVFAGLDAMAALNFMQRGSRYVRDLDVRHAAPELVWREALASGQWPRVAVCRRRDVHNLVAFAAFTMAVSNLLVAYHVSNLGFWLWTFVGRSIASAFLVTAMGCFTQACCKETCLAALLAALVWILLAFAVLCSQAVHWSLFLLGLLCGVCASSQITDMALASKHQSLRDRSLNINHLGSFCGVLYCIVWLATAGTSVPVMNGATGASMDGLVDLLFFVGCGHLFTKSGAYLDLVFDVMEPADRPHSVL